MVDSNQGHVENFLSTQVIRSARASGLIIPGMEFFNQKVVVPGRPDISVLRFRMLLRDRFFQMPLIGSNRVD